MVQSLSQRPPPSPSQDSARFERDFTPLPLFTSELNIVKASIAALEKKVEISFGGFAFKNPHDCKDFLLKHCPKQGSVPIYQCMSTLNSLLQSLGGDVVTETDSNLEEVTQHKTGKTAAQSRVLASLKSRTPSWLVKGGREANDDPNNTDPMTAMSSFAAWDKQDGVTGLVPQALEAFKSIQPTLEDLIKNSCEGHPTATMVFLEMLSTSILFMERWFGKTSSFYLRTLINTFRGPCFTKEQQQSVWDLTKILSRVLFAELSKASSCARAAASSDPFTLNSLVLWATVQHHSVMKAFKEHDFEGHPEVQPKVLDYLGRNAAPRQSIDDLTKKVAEALASLNQVSTMAKQAKATADKALSQVNKGGAAHAGRAPRNRKAGADAEDS
jgi:copper chaperone CopZ